MHSLAQYALDRIPDHVAEKFGPIKEFVEENWPKLIGGAAAFKLFYFYVNRTLYPPGPVPYPLIGNLPDLAAVDGCFYRATEKWRSEYGDVFTIWIGEKPWIFINSLKYIAECNSVAKQHLFAGRQRTNTGDVQMQGHCGIIFSDQGRKRQALRHCGQTGVRGFHRFDKIRYEIVERIAEDFMAADDGGVLESKHVAEDLVQKVAVLGIFGTAQDPRTQEAMRQAHRDLEIHCPSGLPSDVLPILKYVLWQREQGGMDAFLRYKRVALDLVETAVARYQARVGREVTCLTDAVMQASEEVLNPEDQLDSGSIRHILFDLFEAGSQTSVITLHWSFLKLAEDQELQQTLYEEIEAFVRDHGCVPRQKQNHQLPRLQSFLKEVARFWPAAPFGLPRKLLQKTQIGHHVLPKNSTILFNLYRANRDPSYWDDGDVFNPTRFIDKDGHFEDKPCRGFVTFGVGARACIGNQLATDNLFHILSLLLKNRRIEPAGEPISLEPFPAALMLDAKVQKIKFVVRVR